jgi:hypothetical protein
MTNLSNKRVKILKVKGIDVAYINNPKVGCSSIKYSLLRDKALIHDDKIYSNYGDLKCDKFFTVVRSPYSRIVSGFLDKIARPSNIRNELSEQYLLIFGRKASLENVGEDKEGLLVFLNILKELFEKDVEAINPHFRPQYYNILPDFFNYEFIGKLENMDVVRDYLNEYGVELDVYSPHSTGAKDKLALFVDEINAELIKYIYKIDFDSFGYKNL